MNKTTVFLLRDNLASYLNEVAKTKLPLVVCKYKKPIAVIIPPEKKYIKKVDYKQFYGFMGKNGETGVEFENRIRRNKKEREYVKKLLKGIT